MSTFDGFFEDIPFISADCFREQNVKQSKLLFLSHCHADHMEGLSAATDLKIPLYTSEISAIFLQKQYPHLCTIQILPIEHPTQLVYITDEGIELQLLVTAIPAHHCPGSVMFIFQTHTKTILYTGDFRILKSHFKSFPILTKNSFDKMYMDSTFLKNEFMEFPTQIESSVAVCELIAEWLQENPINEVVIDMPAQYGIEFLFINIGRRLKRKIYMHRTQWDKYIHLPDMDTCISHNKSDCRIETKFKTQSGHQSFPPNIRVIMPTAYYWSNWRKGQPIVKKITENEYRVAYSSHCSCTELKDFLELIQPAEVFFNVISENGSEGALRKLLAKIYSPKVDNNTKSRINDICEVKFDNVKSYTTRQSNTFPSLALDKLPPKRIKR